MPYQQPHPKSSHRPTQEISQGAASSYSGQDAYSSPTAKTYQSTDSHRRSPSKVYDARRQQPHTRRDSVRTRPDSLLAQFDSQLDYSKWKKDLKPSISCETDAHLDFFDWLEDTKGEDIDCPQSFPVNGKRIWFSTAGPLSNPPRFLGKARSLWLHEIDPFFYERLVQRVDHLRDAQDQYDYVADGLDQPRKISHLYEARVIEAAKLRILAKRIRYEKLINDTTGSRQDRARQKWDETAEPLQNARDAVAFITSLRWHTRADSSNLRGDELLPDGRVYRDRRAYDPSMAKYILHDLQGQQKHEDETGQGLVDDEELHLDSPRVLKRLTDNFEAGVKKKDIEDLIDHFYGEFKGKVR